MAYPAHPEERSRAIMSSPVIACNFSVQLDAFSLEMDCSLEKRVVGLFGPSGSGKTSALETIAGLRKADRGSLVFGNEIWLNRDRGIFVPPQRRNIGYVPQDHLLFPHLNVQQNLLYGRARANGLGVFTQADFDEVVDVLQLRSLLQRRIGELSGGERQRVSLGRALCSAPRMLMLDEPLASLDIELRHRILPYLLRIKEAFEIPIVVVSHNPFELQALCDEVLALREGKIVARGSPTEVFTQSCIYGMASAEGFNNLLPARVLGHQKHATQLELGKSGGGQILTALRSEMEVGSSVLVGFPANDILVATQKIGGISARNQLNAVVEGIEEIAHKQVVRARLPDASELTIVVELTLESVEELDLRPDRMINLILKSSAIAVFG
jgi:molybdate transport system ATP-binding protein